MVASQECTEELGRYKSRIAGQVGEAHEEVALLPRGLKIKKFSDESRASQLSLTHLASSPGWEAGQTDPLLQVSLAVELEESDVIVQGLAVVVVVDVGGGHPQSLSSR